MSTKVYYGFALDASNFPLAMEQLKAFEDKVKRMCNQRKAKVLAEMSGRRIDKVCMALANGVSAPEGKVDSPVSDAFDEMRKRQKAILSTSHRDPEVDFEVKVVMWYVPAPGCFIGHVIAEDQGAAYKLLRRQPGVSSFQYWNNTDRPSRMSRREWEGRGDVWREIFSGKHGLPLVVTVDADYWLDRKDIAKAVLSHKTRVKRVALDAAYALWLQVNKSTNAAETEGAEDEDRDEFTDRIHSYMDYVSETQEEGAEAARLLAGEIQRINRLLPQDIRSLLFGFDVGSIPQLLATT